MFKVSDSQPGQVDTVHINELSSGDEVVREAGLRADRGNNEVREEP